MFVQKLSLAILSLLSTTLLAQMPPPVILQVESENWVEYLWETTDPLKLGTDPNITTPLLPNTAFPATLLGDIVAINGQPAKGFIVQQARALGATTAQIPGRPIADVVRGSTRIQNFEILGGDGTPIGTIYALGMQGGTLPPGTPSLITVSGNYAIVGGTGAFLAARGQTGIVAQTVVARPASSSEDPSRRRILGGGRLRFALVIYPAVYPQILAVAHSSDFVTVSAARPAAAGEALSVFATGMGPTRPSVDPGVAFPATPLAVVNSPVRVTVNGQPAELLGAVGYPGAVDGYQVNFRLPAGVTRGNAAIVVTSAWIPSAAISIPVQ